MSCIVSISLDFLYLLVNVEIGNNVKSINYYQIPLTLVYFYGPNFMSSSYSFVKTMSQIAESENFLPNVQRPKLILRPTNPPSELPKLLKTRFKIN